MDLLLYQTIVVLRSASFGAAFLEIHRRDASVADAGCATRPTDTIT